MEDTMPRYLVEQGAMVCQLVVDGNAPEGVAWVHSYVTLDKRTTLCVYDGPSAEAIRQAAETNQLPVDRITEVRVLDLLPPLTPRRNR
jgi:Protein of unknown function (DUF4242)